MTEYTVKFFLDRGVVLKMQFEHESKHFDVADFNTTIDEFAQKIGAFQWHKE